jgi:hypothetical protein
MLAQVQNSEAPIYIVLLSYGDEKVSYRAIEQIKDGLFTSAFGCDNNKMTVRDASHFLIIGNEPPDKDDRNFHPTKYNVKQIGTTEQQNTGTTEQQNTGTVEQQNTGTVEHQNTGTVEHQNMEQNTIISSGHKEDEEDEDVPDFPSHEASATINTCPDHSP